MSSDSCVSLKNESVLLDIIRESSQIQSHLEFFLWLRGKMQDHLPHEILIAAWGDFALDIIYFDIVSAMPGIRTELIDDADIVPFIKRVYLHWKKHHKRPFQILAERSVIRCREISDDTQRSALESMKSAMVHAVTDLRGGSDCVYILLGTNENISADARATFAHLLPNIDYILRRIPHLDLQLPAQAPEVARPEPPPAQKPNPLDLSAREVEIMEWVSSGKTNAEIGIILDISAFTVKNHLQRIFKKLNVFTRSQAVSIFSASNQ